VAGPEAQTLDAGTLYVVATPIGNLADLSPRAVQVFTDVEILLCEDTRHTGHLLQTLGLKKVTWSLHEHNELGKIPSVLERLQAGATVALVSDAGTPALSDPGQLLVDAAQEAGLQVRTIPGPFAVAAALAASGLTPIPHAFWGFLPKKAGERKQLLERVLLPAPDGQPMTHAFYVPGRDLQTVAADLAGVRPFARACVARELTKLHEGYVRALAGDLPLALTDEMLRGEAVLLVEVSQASAPAVEVPDARALIVAAKAAGLDRKTATREIGEKTGLSRNEIYALWLEVSGIAI
jgi:16S rRNA (cytidine1402-2'-O)-methyltransferase